MYLDNFRYNSHIYMTNAAKEQQRYIVLHVYNLTIKTELGH